MTDPTTVGPATPRIGVLDTDTGLLTVMGNRLDRLGWEHRVLGSPVSSEALVRMRLNALVVDPAVLGASAWEYLERICRELPGIGVVVCTGGSSVGQRVRGLRMGADDWVTKPCHPEELIARVEAVLRRRRRSEAPAESAPVRAGEVEVRLDRIEAFVRGRTADLTRREFELLWLLAEADGRVLEREEIYQRVWGYAMAHGDRSVDVFVRKLRQKLGRVSPGWSYIHTHFGVGYRFAAEPVQGAGEEGEEDQADRSPPAPAGGPADAVRRERGSGYAVVQ